MAVTLAVVRFRPVDRAVALTDEEVAEQNKLDPMVFYSLKSGSQRMGPQDAPVSIVVFEAYSCGKCAEYWPSLEAIRERYPDHVNVVLRTLMPNLDRSNGAVSVHLAGECANAQGKLQEFSRAVYSDPTATRVQDRWLSIGDSIGIPDLQEFEACTRAYKYLDQVKEDTRLGEQLGIPGTPTSFVNGRGYVGVVPLPVLDSLVRKILRSPIES